MDGPGQFQQSCLSDQESRFLPFTCIPRVNRCASLQNLTSLVLHVVFECHLNTGTCKLKHSTEFELGLCSHQVLCTRTNQVLGLPIKEATYVRRDEQEHTRGGHLSPQLALPKPTDGKDIAPTQCVYWSFSSNHDDAFSTLALFQMQGSMALKPCIATVFSSDSEDHINRSSSRSVFQLPGYRDNVTGMADRGKSRAHQLAGIVLKHFPARGG